MASSTPVLKKGSKGEAVSRLQEGLQALGYHVGPIDGDFGPETVKAVKAFQTDNGLAADGIVGPKTWKTFEERWIHLSQ